MGIKYKIRNENITKRIPLCGKDRRRLNFLRFWSNFSSSSCSSLCLIFFHKSYFLIFHNLELRTSFHCCWVFLVFEPPPPLKKIGPGGYLPCPLLGGNQEGGTTGGWCTRGGGFFVGKGAKVFFGGFATIIKNLGGGVEQGVVQ